MIQPAEHVCAVYATLRCRHLQLSGGCLVCYVFTLFSHEASMPVRKKTPMHSSRQHYGRSRSSGRVKVVCVGELRSYLHWVNAGESPGRRELDGGC